MKIKVIQYKNDLGTELLINKLAIVIDVFRATSVITTALAHGAKSIIVADDIKEALMIYNQQQCGDYLLGGERNSHKINGFNLGNSPQFYTNAELLNKNVILTTTNGTKAIKYCEAATEVFIASMLNAKYVAEKVAQQQQDSYIVCAGSQHDFALEDALCAGMILYEMKQYTEFNADDYCYALMSLYEQNRTNIHRFLSPSKSYQLLKANDYKDDIDFCIQENIYSIVPRLINGELII